MKNKKLKEKIFFFYFSAEEFNDLPFMETTSPHHKKSFK